MRLTPARTTAGNILNEYIFTRSSETIHIPVRRFGTVSSASYPHTKRTQNADSRASITLMTGVFDIYFAIYGE